ncbi:hypothetical protein RCL1_003136 [Eukaryota sp. TZLM3-RCL]
MFILDWIFKALNYLGLYGKRARILLLGLDNAGKSTLLHVLKYGRVITPQPTSLEVHSRLTLGTLRIDAVDLGGHQSMRQVWREHFVAASAVVFVVDAADHDRFSEAREELHALLAENVLSNIPFVILGNKIDLSKAVSEHNLKHELGVSLMCTGKSKSHQLQEGVRPFEVFMCSVVERTGYADAFRWLSHYV